jgi:hypothetical protein
LVKTKIHITFLALVFLLLTVFAKGQAIKGKIVDSKTDEPLPLVNIVYDVEGRMGTTTNFEGIFEIPAYTDVVKEIQVSFIGYDLLIIPKSEIPRNNKSWVIKIEESVNALDEISLVAQENPALRIVRNAIANRKTNNPKNYDSYTYTSYSKDVFTFKGINLGDTLSRKDSIRAYKDRQSAESRHLLVLESVTKKYFKAPNKSIEKVIGSKISGFSDPTMGTVPDGFQSFGFYDNTISLADKYYLNPISSQGDKKYIFILKDTTFNNNDTTFIMDYLPDIGANFEGFRGEIQINSNKWAIEKITAFPFDEGVINLSLEQHYILVDDTYWFPDRLSFNYVMEKFPLRESGALFSGKTFLDSITINEPLNDSMFNHLKVDFIEGAGRKGDDFWRTHRAENLDAKEAKTYVHMDSVGDRYNFDGLLRSTSNIYNGYLTFKRLDLAYANVVSYNQHEGWRLGLGLYTNKYISKDFKIGGYFGYGTKDKEWKYGARGFYYFNQSIDNYLEVNYRHDLRAPGLINIRYWNFLADFRDQFFSTIMDENEEVSIYLNWRVFDYFETKVGFKNFQLNPTYIYEFNPKGEGVNPTTGPFGFAESYIKVRWAPKEKFKNNYGQRISAGSDLPLIFVSWSHGFSNLGWGEYDYNKFEIGTTYDHYFSGFGNTTIRLEGGYIDAVVPYSINFNGRPSYKPGFSVVLSNTFQTMRFNEFTSSTYGAMFLSHNFKSLIFKSGIFKPQFILKHAMTVGSLKSPEVHSGNLVNAQPLDKGFYESGVVLHNLLRMNTFNVGYFGVGVGVFYRYGPYQYPIERENWAFKLAMMYSIN